MTTAQIIQNMWAGLATAAAVALLGLYIAVRRRLHQCRHNLAELYVEKANIVTELGHVTDDLRTLDRKHITLRQEFERKLDQIVRLEHELDRTTPLKHT